MPLIKHENKPGCNIAVDQKEMQYALVQQGGVKK